MTTLPHYRVTYRRHGFHYYVDGFVSEGGAEKRADELKAIPDVSEITVEEQAHAPDYANARELPILTPGQHIEEMPVVDLLTIAAMTDGDIAFQDEVGYVWKLTCLSPRDA